MSDFLFARPSFIAGLGATIDLGGTMEIFNESPSPEEADFLALRSDWRAVGQDIQNAMSRFTFINI